MTFLWLVFPAKQAKGNTSLAFSGTGLLPFCRDHDAGNA